MNTTVNTPVVYNVITINRNKEVVRSSAAETFFKALSLVSEKRAAADNANWKTFVNSDSYYTYPSYIVRKNHTLAGTFITSFSMINGKKEEGGEYYFTYIKKAA